MEYYINLICSVFVFIIGTLFGSFFTLATYRIPRHQDIVKTRSYCPNCKHRLEFFDCFPILSYISTIGRCKYCKKPISIRYPLMEFASGMVFLLIFLIFGFSWQAFVLLACYIYLFIVIGSDIMKSKMTASEIKEVEKVKEEKNKKGAINVEILVAFVAFVIFFVSSLFITRNYNSTLLEYTKKSEALNICLNNINEAKATEFSTLVSNTGISEVGNTRYNYSITVSPYIKEGTQTVDSARVIESVVNYEVNGEQNTVSLRCIKVEDIL